MPGLVPCTQLRPVFKAMNTHKLPVVLSEDNTKAQPRLDVALEGDKVMLYGCNGGAYEVSAADDIITLVKQHGMANQLYVWALAPMARHGLYYPIMAIANDGTNATLGDAKIEQYREHVIKACKAEGLDVLAVVTDGDSKMRCVQREHADTCRIRSGMHRSL